MVNAINAGGKCEQIRRNLRIWSHLLKKSLMENFIFCAVFRFQFRLEFWYIKTLTSKMK